MLSVREREKVSYMSLIQLSLPTSPFLSTLENSVIQVSDQGLRKVLYQRVSQSPFCSSLSR
jgi:hypothetical protein